MGKIKEFARVTHLSQNEIDEIREALKKMLNQVPKTSDAYEQLSATLKRFDEALGDSKKSLKDQLNVYHQFNTALEYFNFLMGEQEGIRDRLIRQRKEEMEAWEQYAKVQDRVAAKHKEAKKDMKLLTTVSNQLSQALVTAFMTGEFAIDRFLKAVLAAIVQMLILKAITSAIFGGVGSPGGVGLPFIGPLLNIGASGAGNRVPIGPAGFKGGRPEGVQTINIEGEISMQKNKFVVELDRARNVQQTNYGVGRGVLLET